MNETTESTARARSCDQVDLQKRVEALETYWLETNHGGQQEAIEGLAKRIEALEKASAAKPAPTLLSDIADMKKDIVYLMKHVNAAASRSCQHRWSLENGHMVCQKCAEVKEL